MGAILMYNQTITLYNHYRTGRVDSWKRTVLDQVQYIISFDKAMTSDGVINVAALANVFIKNRTGYVDPVAYQAAESKAGIWTLNASNNLDAIVYGSCTQDITGSYLLDDLIKGHGARIIRGVKDLTQIRTAISRLKHWEVVCT